MCLKIRCRSVKENLIFPLVSFIFLFLSIHLTIFSIFKDHMVIKNIYVSFGNILSFIPLLISNKTLKISTSGYLKFKSYKSKKRISDSIKSLEINYEYNDKLEKITKINWYSLVILSFIDYLQELFLFLGYNLFKSKNSIFFWSIDILSLYLFSKIFLSCSLYRHHIVSLFIFTIFDIYLSYTIIFGPNFNYWEIVFIIVNNFLYSFKIVYEKKLMEYNFISYYELNFTIGVLTIIYSIITLIVETIIYEKDKIPAKYELFVDNALIYWKKIIKENNKIIIKEIFLTIFYTFLMGLSNIFLLITIFNLTPFHVLIIKIFLCIGFNLIIKIKEQDISYKVFIINLCIYFLSILVLFFFLEIIELDFCGLNKNTREKILERSLDKSNVFINDKSINGSNTDVENENNTESSVTYSNSNETF